MNSLTIIGASMLLLSTTLQADDSSAAASFRIEVIVHKDTSAPTSIPIECPYGCAWDDRTIDCPAETKECRVIIDGRLGIEPWTKEAVGVQAVLPWSGTVCLGLVAPNPEPIELDRSTTSGAIVRRVETGSPAEVAGIKVGDLFGGFNGVRVRRAEDLHEAIQRAEAGQPFEATLNRNGEEIHVSGHLGIFTTAGCLPADPQLLAMPSAEPPPIPFSISIPDLRIPIELRCLEGCDLWRSTPVAPCPPATSCSFTYNVGHSHSERVAP